MPDFRTLIISNVGKISGFLALLSSLCVGLMMFAICSDVFVRLFFHRSIYGVVEYSEFLMVGLVYFGLAFAEFSGQHISVDLLTSRISTRSSFVLIFLGKLITLFVVVWLAYATIVLGITSTLDNEFRFGLITVPVWPDRLIIALGWFWLAVQLLINLINFIYTSSK